MISISKNVTFIKCLTHFEGDIKYNVTAQQWLANTQCQMNTAYLNNVSCISGWVQYIYFRLCLASAQIQACGWTQ